jgi:hypothetical protein
LVAWIVILWPRALSLATPQLILVRR